MTTLEQAARRASDALEHVLRCVGFGQATIHWSSSTWVKLDNAAEGLLQALSAAPAVPNGDELRRIARAARTSASDDASPTEYVLAGWKAAMLAASPTPPAEQQAITPESGVVYAELPDFDSGNEPIWEAVFKWKAANPGPDARKKTMAVESAIINSLRDFADRTHALRVQSAPKAAPGVGNSGFDHKTAADFLSGKTVSDEAVRKFVAASRWAHDERAALSATLLAMHGVLTSREAEIALLKKALLEAETAPQPAPAPLSDDVVRDAARYQWLRRWKGQEHEPPFTVQHEIDGTLWGGDLDAAIDAALASQGGK